MPATIESVVSMYLASDLKAGATVIDTDYCRGQDVLVVAQADGELWHYLWTDVAMWTPGEIAHSVATCRKPQIRKHRKTTEDGCLECGNPNTLYEEVGAKDALFCTKGCLSRWFGEYEMV